MRTCGICKRERLIPDHYGACPSCLDAALTDAFGVRTSTERRLGNPLPSRLSAVARPNDGVVPLPSGNTGRATG